MSAASWQRRSPSVCPVLSCLALTTFCDPALSPIVKFLVKLELRLLMVICVCAAISSCCPLAIGSLMQPRIQAFWPELMGGPAPVNFRNTISRGTLNMLEYCREHKSGIVLLSTSRVYSVRDLAALPMLERVPSGQAGRLELDEAQPLPPGVSPLGITEHFSTQQPISLYGATKLASEVMAVEYGFTFGFPVWIDRCGVLAGAGQFGTAEQGIFSYWLHAHAAAAQTSLHRIRWTWISGPRRLPSGRSGPTHSASDSPRSSARSHLPCQRWRAEFHVACPTNRLVRSAIRSPRPKPEHRPRPFDIPWLVMNSARVRTETSGWTPTRSLLRSWTRSRTTLPHNPGWLERVVRYEVAAASRRHRAPFTLLSIVIPARDEEGCIESTVEHLHVELRLHNVPHEIVVVDDGSTDSTWEKLGELAKPHPHTEPDAEPWTARIRSRDHSRPR